MKNIILIFSLFLISIYAFGDSSTYLKGPQLSESNQSLASNGGTTSLTSLSPMKTVITGTLGHTVKLPNTTTIPVGYSYHVINKSTRSVIVKDFSDNTLETITTNTDKTFILFSGGTWQTASGGSAGKTLIGVSPVSIAQDTTTATFSMPLATTATSGYLSSADWNTFNSAASLVTGTATYIPKFTGTGLTSSLMTDNGVGVGIGTTTTTAGFEVFGNDIFVTENGLGNTGGDGLVLQNTTAGAAGVPQWSPRLRFRGYAWDTSLLQSDSIDWKIEAKPASAISANDGGALAFSFSKNLAAYSQPMSISSAGALTITSIVGSGSVAMSTSSIGSASIQSNITTANTTGGDGIVAASTFATTVGSTTSKSPRIRLRSTAWDTGSSANKTNDFMLENVPTSASPTTANLNFGYSYAGGSYSNLMTLSSNGMLGVGVASPLMGVDTAYGRRVSTIPLSALTTISGTVGSASTTIPVVSTANYPQSGVVWVNTPSGSNEVISYTGILGNSFIGATRGLYGTTASNLVNGDTVDMAADIITATITAAPLMFTSQSHGTSFGVLPDRYVTAGGITTNLLRTYGGLITNNGQSIAWGASTAAITGQGVNNSTDFISFKTNSAERMRLDALGNVAIGTATTTTATLTVAGTASISGQTNIYGNVGIKTAIPATALHVTGDITSTGYTYFGLPSVDGSFRMYVSGGALITEKRISGVWTELSRVDEL